jgi:beta-1,4-mannosyl-glycoprotein beta-1,4-N-acetylglucosaminyltransferase|tara:strand:- start:3992 stop:4804 length:813 start_codon:yes stop_codon:yes gene_type:complete
MKIYDCFSYLDEDLLLDVRLNILNDYVDYFVIIEGNKTWQNNYKKLRFNVDNFKKFKDKIIYVPVEDLPDGDNPYLRENFQRNCITRGLKNSNDNDLILISDLDEIPNPSLLKNFDPNMKYAVFKQMHFYYKLNLQSKTNPYWYGSRVCVKKHLRSPQWLRGLKFKKRPWWRIDKKRLNNIFDNGGWHFCNLKSPKDLLYKYKNLCETNDPYVFKEKIDPKYLNEKEILKKIKLGKDIIGRGHEYKSIKIDKNFPNYLVNNLHLYSDWIV